MSPRNGREKLHTDDQYGECQELLIVLLIGDIYFNQSESDVSRKTASPLARPCTVTCNTVIFIFQCFVRFQKKY